MDSLGQVILILKMGLNIAPPAIYFLILGLVNSHSRPHIVSSRSDWLGLTCVFFPVVLYPVIILANRGYYLPACACILLFALIVYLSLPRVDAGWVVYNISIDRAKTLIVQTLQDEGIAYQCDDNRTIRLPANSISMKLSSFALLKNVTISVEAGENYDIETLMLIEANLKNSLESVEVSSNLSGPALLITGTLMLILPLFMMVRNIDAFVRVVSDLLPV